MAIYLFSMYLSLAGKYHFDRRFNGPYEAVTRFLGRGTPIVASDTEHADLQEAKSPTMPSRKAIVAPGEIASVLPPPPAETTDRRQYGASVPSPAADGEALAHSTRAAANGSPMASDLFFREIPAADLGIGGRGRRALV